jgi:DinB family protein
MDTDFKNIAGMFRANTDIVNKAIAGVEPDHWFRKPGDDSNHLTWVLGHLIVHRGQTLKVLGVDWDNAWAELFARGSERVADVQYPSVDKILNAWQDVSAKLSEALKTPPEEVMTKEAPKGPPSFDGKTSGTIAFYAFHDTYHVGQVSFLRKWLGYGQTIG